mgnify:CR=1 FL=1
MAKKLSRGYFIGGIIFATLLIFAVIKGDLLLTQLLSKDDMLPVRAVQIDGALQQLTRKQVADLTGKVCAGENIATLDLSLLQKTLQEEPWVAQVAIKKKMPDTLIVSIVEHVPAAYWNEKGFYDAKTASVFYPEDNSFHAPLVRLGAERDNLAKEVYDSAVLFIHLMQGSPYQMYALYLDKVHSYTLTLNNKAKTRLILGRGRSASAVRLKRFLKAFGRTELELDEVAYVDLRYDVGFAVGKVESTGDKKDESVSKKQ